MGVLTIKEMGNKMFREKDGLHSGTVELQSTPIWSVNLIEWTLGVETLATQQCPNTIFRQQLEETLFTVIALHFSVLQSGTFSVP